MPKECDVALLGTGVAPLIAAFNLLSEGKSVLLLNPDWDFFCENSELPFDPLWPVQKNNLTPDRLLKNSSDRALSVLRPNYPGAIEFWPDYEKKGFHDFLAPHVRSRDRIWIPSGQNTWETFEDIYLETSDAGLNPKILEGITAARSFPGFSSKNQWENLRGISIPKLCDVDVYRYQNGLLEFVRERLEPENIVVAASHVEITEGGIRFHSQGVSQFVSIREGVNVFWTPSLNAWVMAQANKNEFKLPEPSGVRLWEEWSLISREVLDPSVMGVFEDMIAWAQVEGVPEDNPHQDPTHLHRLSVLKAGPLVSWKNWRATQSESHEVPWASSESFAMISQLCHDFLGWEFFSVRSLRPRAVFEWSQNILKKISWGLSKGNPHIFLVTGSDGPLLEVVRRTHEVCSERHFR